MEMITGALIASAFFMLGYAVKGYKKQPIIQVKEEPKEIETPYRTPKGLLSYKKSITDKKV